MSLEVIEDVSTETQASTPAPEATATPDSAAPAVGEGTPVAAPATTTADAATPAAPAYQPNFKYSVRGQEKEIPEKYRALVKAAEDEKELKELFEKAEGLDFVKQDRAALKQQHEGFVNQVKPYLSEYHKFTSARDNGNLGAAFKVAGISDDAIFQYALEKLQADQNPQLAQYQQQSTDAYLKQFDMEGQLQQFQMEKQQLQAQQFDFNLSQAITAHKDVVGAIEAKWGQPGSFKDEVIAFGYAQAQMGNNLSEAQAVEAVLNKYKPFLAASPTSQAAPAVAHQAPRVVLPNTGGTNVSMIQPRAKSIDDLRKAYKEEVG